jgi:hypothetical protein
MFFLGEYKMEKSNIRPIDKKIPAKGKVSALLFVAFITLLLFVLLASGFPKAFITDYRNTVSKGTPVFERIEQARDIFDTLIVESVPAHDFFIEVYGVSQKILSKKTIPDPNYSYLFLTREGQITYQIPQRDLSTEAEKVIALKGELEKEGLTFLWVLAPFRLLDEKSVTSITFDYGKENADYFIDQLSNSGVKSLDLRREFRYYLKEGFSQGDLFYNTDHHWTIPAALKATGVIADTLNHQFNFSIDTNLYNEENYIFKTHKDSFVGSMGRRVGLIYGGKDDFTLVLPKFPTDIQLWETDYGITTQSRGSFEDSVLLKEHLEDPELTANRYAAYHGDNEELVFINHNVNRGKILIIKDSFGVPVYSFLSLGVNEVRALDPRLYKGSILEYAKEFQPEVVIFLYNVDSLNSQMFQWEL